MMITSYSNKVEQQVEHNFYHIMIVSDTLLRL